MRIIQDFEINYMLSFKQRRKALKLTLREVESITGLSNAYLSQLENNKIDKPSFKTVITLHNLYKSQED